MLIQNYFINPNIPKTLKCNLKKHENTQGYLDILGVRNNHFCQCIFLIKIKKNLPDFCYKRVESRESDSI